MGNVLWYDSAIKYAIDRVYGKVYLPLARGWMAIPKRASLSLFSPETPFAGSNKSQGLLCDNTVRPLVLTC